MLQDSILIQIRMRILFFQLTTVKEMVNLWPFQNQEMARIGLSVLTYDNIPLIKAIENIVYDQDTDIDIFVMGDSNPTNGIDLSPTSTLKVYETGEVNILENELISLLSIKQQQH